MIPLSGNTVIVVHDSARSLSNGKIIFNTYCSSCHSVHKELSGPMLGSITKKRPQNWLIPFIKNSQDIIISGDEYSNHLFEEYNHVVMPSFRTFSDEKIKDVLFYIEEESLISSEIINDEKLNSHPGKTLFENQCTACHAIGYESYGPALGSISKRRPKKWLVKFITNSHNVIHEGDPYANYVFEHFGKKGMPAFEFLDQKSILNILDFIEVASESSSQIAGVNGSHSAPSFSGSLNPSYKFSNVETYKKEHGLFMKIFLSVIALGAAYIHYRILRMVYKYLVKSEK